MQTQLSFYTTLLLLSGSGLALASTWEHHLAIAPAPHPIIAPETFSHRGSGRREEADRSTAAQMEISDLVAYRGSGRREETASEAAG